MWTRELMNQFLKNHQLNKAEIGVTNESISDWISGLQDTFTSTKHYKEDEEWRKIQKKAEECRKYRRKLKNGEDWWRMVRNGEEWWRTVILKLHNALTDLQTVLNLVLLRNLKCIIYGTYDSIPCDRRIFVQCPVQSLPVMTKHQSYNIVTKWFQFYTSDGIATQKQILSAPLNCP